VILSADLPIRERVRWSWDIRLSDMALITDAHVGFNGGLVE
jgi:hypothetical protein